MNRLFALTLAALFLLPTQAEAQNEDGYAYVRYAIKQQKRCYRHVDAWGAVSYPCYYRPVRVREREYPNHTYRLPAGETYSYRAREDEDRWERREPSLERGEHCKDAQVRVVGGLHLTKEGALNDAVRQWQSTVRYDHGEKFMDIESARGYVWRCDRAGTNETLAGKIGEALSGGNGFQRRCVVMGKPCRMPVVRGDKDEPR